MPGTGTYNLNRIWRALGIKNPTNRMFENVQPVLNVGNMDQLVPQHHPPMGIYGGDLNAVAAEFSMIEISCRSPGGSLLPWIQFGGATVQFGIIPAALPPGTLVVTPDSGPYSLEPMVSVVKSGTDPVNPLTRTTSPTTPAANFAPWPCATEHIYLPPAAVLVFVRDTVNVAINNWSMCLIDIMAAEMPPD